MDWQQKTGEESYFITGDHSRKKEPFLSESIIGRYTIRKMVTLLHQSLRKHSRIPRHFLELTYMKQTEVFDIRIENNRVTGIVTSEGIITCEKVVIAGGSWSTNYYEYFHSDWGTYPVKGECLQ